MTLEYRRAIEWRPRGGALALALLLTACGPCNDCLGTGGIAEVVEREGTVQRDHAYDVKTWLTAEEGDDLAIGDAIRTGAESGAILELQGGSRLRLDDQTLVRFLSAPPGEELPRIHVATGEARLETRREERLHTRVGPAIIEEGSTVVMRAEQEGIRYRVAVGSATLELDGEQHDLAREGGLVVSLGGAILEEGSGPDGANEEPSHDDPTEDGTMEPEVTIELDGPARVRAPDGSWTIERGRLEVGPGTEVRLPRRGRADLSRGAQRLEVDGPARFTVGALDAPLVELREGRARMHADGEDVAVDAGGLRLTARGAAGTRSSAEVSTRGPRTTVGVDQGRLDMKGDGVAETLLAGQGATLERGALRVRGRGPAHAQLQVPAGESFTLRDAKAPTAVSLRFGRHCPDAGVVELVTRSGRVLDASRGERAANVRLAPGFHRYQLRCIDATGVHDDAAARGTVKVVRDTGLAPLPRTPPRTVVDTDGRQYTVMYQNLLPEVIVRWPKAPKGEALSLHVKSPQGEQVFRTGKPRHVFSSGDLGEGRTTLRFETQSGRRSHETTLTIAFDNAAPTVTLRDPYNGSFDAGSTVRIAGVALQGWTVRAAGKRLAVDRHGRFSGEVSVPAGQQGVAVRLSHPRRGVQYYVRRAKGAL